MPGEAQGYVSERLAGSRQPNFRHRKKNKRGHFKTYRLAPSLPLELNYIYSFPADRGLYLQNIFVAFIELYIFVAGL